MASDLEALTVRSNRALVGFLNTDLDLGFTFCETARIEADLDPPAVERLLDKVREVIVTVEQFSPRIQEEAERRDIELRTARLREVFMTMADPLG